MSRPRNVRGGFTLIEVLITVGLFSGLLAMFSMTLDGSLKSKEVAEVENELAEEGLEALNAIRNELARTSLGGGLPLVFDTGTIGATYPGFAHPPAHGVPGALPVREIAYRTPVDADDDGWPDLGLRWIHRLEHSTLRAGRDRRRDRFQRTLAQDDGRESPHRQRDRRARDR